MKQSPLTPKERDAAKLVLARIDRQVEECEAHIVELRGTRAHLLKEFGLEEYSQPPLSGGGGLTQSTLAAQKEDELAPRAAKPSRTQKIDYKKVLLEVATALAPEFTSHEFRSKCLEDYPGHDSDFTLTKVKKRLNKAAGFEDDALLTLVAKGAGRRPPRFRVNTKK
ncbi:MAG: hypothetical protein IPP19_03875 [Verrucomicrobia bacterium]|nr:hypothetical protein [Verrucomicrobiota bacterium]